MKGPDEMNLSKREGQTNDRAIPISSLSKSDAAVLIVLGQSNAHGHGLLMSEEDKIRQPMKNVFGLSRENNQRFDLADVTWSGYQSCGMNLGETQDHTYCLASEMAKMWQQEIDQGNQRGLPDLYIIQISIGAQGLSDAKGNKNNMWNPYRPMKLIPGSLGTVDISLFPFSLHILRLAMNNLRESKQNPVVIGLHWSAGNDSGIPHDRREELNSLYHILFAGFHEAIGQSCTIYLEKLLHKNRLRDLGLPEDGMHFENALYRKMAADDERIQIISAEDSPYWQDGTETNGIFVDDHVHYTAAVQKWFAEYHFRRVVGLS